MAAILKEIDSCLCHIWLKIVKDTIAGLWVRLEKLRFGVIHKKVGVALILDFRF
jgi:hypothetical protein